MVDDDLHSQPDNDSKRVDNDEGSIASDSSDNSSEGGLTDALMAFLLQYKQDAKNKRKKHKQSTNRQDTQNHNHSAESADDTAAPSSTASTANPIGTSATPTPNQQPRATASDATMSEHASIGGRPRQPSREASHSLFEEALNVVEDISRFPFQLSEREIENQFEKKFKLLSSIVLPPFSPDEEEAFEDWVDEAAPIVVRNHLSVPLFQEAWIVAAKPGLATAIRRIPPPATHEELVDAIALQLGFTGFYLRQLKSELTSPKQQQTVMQTREYVENRLFRAYRLSLRWKEAFPVSNQSLKDLIFMSLPDSITSEYQLIRKLKTLSWCEIWKRAKEKESFLKIKPSSANVAAEALAADDNKRDRTEFETGTPSSTLDSNSSNTKQRVAPTTPCPACGKPGHWKRECKFKSHQCYNCHRHGHIAAACRNLVHKDASGRVETCVDIRPSRTTTSTRKDHTKLDKTITAQSNITELVTDQKKKKQKEAAKRAKKNANKPNKRSKTTNREQLNAEESSVAEFSQSESAGSDEDEDVVEEKRTRAIDGHVAFIATAPSRVVRAPVKLNGMDHIAIMDSGASRSLCSFQKAQELQYKPSARGKPMYFKGLANLTGTPTEPVQLIIGNRSTPINFYMINKPDLPLVIGSCDLVKLNLEISLKHNAVTDADSHEIVEVGLTADDEVTEIDRVTQKPVSASDEELLEAGLTILKEKTQHLSSKQAEQVKSVFINFKEVWLRPKAAQAKTHIAKFEVEGPPIKMKMRPLAPELIKELDIQLDDMLRNGVISPSKSDWGGVPIFAKKRDGTWRLCLDFRKLNQRMAQDIYPLPLLWSQVQRAAGHKYYTTLDLNWGFWNLPLHPESRKYTALVTHRGLFEFNIIPFGIKNSPAEFQRMMDLTFGHLQNDNIIWYIDDIVLFANTVPEMLHLIERVLKVMKDSGLYIKLVKTTLLRDHALALGHIVNQFGLRPNPQKVQGIKDAKLPSNISELRGFLGSVNFLRKYIPHCADLQEPLVALLRKHTKFELTDERIAAFESLKDAISEQTLLAAPRGSKGFTIYCDASDYGVGAVLLQDQDNVLVPLEFASKSLTSAERNWPTFEKEAFAIRWAVAKFEDYIKIFGATVYTDQKSLQWMMKHEHGKVKRWSLYLQQFPLIIKHVSGKDNVIADWLSRSMDADDPFDDESETMIPQFTATSSSSNDSMPDSERYLLSQGSIIPHLPSVADINRASKEENKNNNIPKEVFEGDDGLYYHTKTAKLYIPTVLQHHFIYWTHTSKRGAHSGINRTTNRLAQWVWWPKLRKSISTYIDGCLICQRYKPIYKSTTISGVLSKPFPNELISLDVVGPRQWMNHKWYYICIIDHCTRFIVLHALSTPPTSADIINLLQLRWLPIFQMPFAILSDRGSEFTSRKFVEFVNNEIGAAIVLTSPYYPQGNAINEASHSAINNTLTLLNGMGESDFSECLQIAATIHNCSPHSATGFTPYFHMFGFEATLPGWQSLQRQAKDLPTRMLVRKEELVRNVYRQLLTKEQQSTIHKPTSIEVDDWIVYQLSNYQKSKESISSSKFSAKWSLPAKILQIKDKQVTVRSWEGKEVDLPVSKIFKLRGEVHPSLQPLNVHELQILQRPRFPLSLKPAAPSVSWNEFLTNQQSSKPPTDLTSSPTAKKRKTTTK